MLTPAPSGSSTDRQSPVARVFLNGCFDLLHPGHFNAYRQARELIGQKNAGSDVELVVGLHDEATVKSEKGKQGVLTDSERFELLEGISLINKIVPNVPYAQISPKLLDSHDCTHSSHGSDPVVLPR